MVQVRPYSGDKTTPIKIGHFRLVHALISTCPVSMSAQSTENKPSYVHGHTDAVLRSHKWRTAQNSAAFLLPHIKPDDVILDVGCGPGTITVDLAKYVPKGRIIGIDPSGAVIEQANALASEHGVPNVSFEVGDIYDSKFGDKTFNIVYAHQLLQHIPDPVAALVQMKKLTIEGGIVAARDSDYQSMTWHPEVQDLHLWQDRYLRTARYTRGEPNAGRMLHQWACEAAFPRDKVEATASVWCYNTEQEVAWWSELWAERVLTSSFAKNAIASGIATQDELNRISQAWKEWGATEYAWFTVICGEILCHV